MEICSAEKASALQIGEENVALSAKLHLLRVKLFLLCTSAENDHLGNMELSSSKVRWGLGKLSNLPAILKEFFKHFFL